MNVILKGGSPKADPKSDISMYFLIYEGPKRTNTFKSIEGEKELYSLLIYATPYNIDVNEFGLSIEYLNANMVMWKVFEYKVTTDSHMTLDSTIYDDKGKIAMMRQESRGV